MVNLRIGSILGHFLPCGKAGGLQIRRCQGLAVDLLRRRPCRLDSEVLRLLQHWGKVSSVCLFISKRSLSKTLSCDSVVDGAFFPILIFRCQRKMRQHARLHVMMPAHILTDFIVVHAQLCLGLLKTLLNRQAQSA